MKKQIINKNFIALDESSMIEINGGEDTTPTVSLWLWNLIKHLFV